MIRLCSNDSPISNKVQQQFEATHWFSTAYDYLLIEYLEFDGKILRQAIDSNIVIRTHTHIYVYIYIYVCVCVCVC